jgi:hypothetical protein
MKRFLSVIFLSTFFLLIGGADNVEACSCSGRPQGVKGVQTCGYYQRSEDIFIGLAEKVEIDKEIGLMKVTFSVEKAIRGTNEKTVEVFTCSSSACCGYPFKQGERYFVYGRKDGEGKFHESLCGPTVLLKNAEDDLEYVKDIEDGKPGTRIFGSVYEDKQPTLKDQRIFDPLANIEITIKGKKLKYKTLTDEKGNYLFKDVPKENYQVFAKLPKGYRELFVRADLTEHFAGGCDGENFRVTRQGSIRGRVANFPSREIQNPWNRDSVQQPKVALIPLGENNEIIPNRSYEEKWAYRDKFEYFFDIVPAGNYLLTINPNNCPFPNNGVPAMFFPGTGDQSKAKIITVKEGENLVLEDFISLPLLEERLISGVVLNIDKTPAVNAVVRVTDAYFGSGKCSNFNTEIKTDEFGKFRFKGFVTYLYKLEAYGVKQNNQIQKYAKGLILANDNENDEIELILDQSF